MLPRFHALYHAVADVLPRRQPLMLRRRYADDMLCCFR